MQLIRASVKSENLFGRNLNLSESAGRICYQSEETHHKKVVALTENPEFEPNLSYIERVRKAHKQVSEEFLSHKVKLGHLSLFEHEHVTFRWITDRATANQLVRHRIGAYSQESLRYVKNKGIYIIPQDFSDLEPGEYDSDKNIPEKYLPWFEALKVATENYDKLLQNGVLKETARSILPLATKTEILSTFNLRQWRHVLKERLAPQAQKDIRVLCQSILEEFLASEFRVVFESLKKD